LAIRMNYTQIALNLAKVDITEFVPIAAGLAALFVIMLILKPR